MYSVQVDENNYFTGNYAKVGKVSRGVDMASLPQDMTGLKAKCWQINEAQEVIQTSEPIYDVDEETGEVKVDPETNMPIVKKDKDGNPLYVTRIESHLEWHFDDVKYDNLLKEEFEKKKKEKIDYIDSYKHEARMQFPYGNVGGIQRFDNNDIMSINLSLEGINKGLITTVMWKYSNGKYEEADAEYLENMLLKGGMLLSKCFVVEAEIVKQINAITNQDELDKYNEKEEFDKLFYTED